MNFKELLDIAKAELVDLTSVDNPDFRLEQAAHDKDANLWEIVVSYLVENTSRKISSLTDLSTGFEYQRMYKALKINADKKVVGHITAAEREVSEASLKYYRDIKNVVDTSREEGMEAKAVTIAQRMLAAGIAVAQIAAFTELPTERIQALAQGDDQ